MIPAHKHSLSHLSGIISLVILCLLTSFKLAAQSLTPLTFKDTIQAATKAFQSNDFEKSAYFFESLSSQFSNEPEFLEAREKLLPLMGYSCFATKAYPCAIEHFEAYLEIDSLSKDKIAFAYFHLAKAYQSESALQKAIEAYDAFIKCDPHSREASLCKLQQCELLFQTDQNEQGINALKAFIAAPNPSNALQKQARLRLLQHAQRLNRYHEVDALLLNERWSVRDMPELAVLTYAAIQTGERYLKEGRNLEAIKTFRLVPPHRILIKAQARRLNELKEVYEKRKQQYPESSPILGYFRNLITRVESQWNTLQSSDDYTHDVHMRLAHAFLLDQRIEEASLLFSDLAANKYLTIEMRAQASYNLILCSNAKEAWDLSHKRAKTFLQQYPKHPLTPQTFYLVAVAFQKQKQYLKAIDTFTTLLAHYPEHSHAPRWQFARGMNYTFQKNYSAARVDFSAFSKKNPKHNLYWSSQLWNGLTHFFEKNYNTAIDSFESSLSLISQKHPLYPEFKYRIGNTEYASRDYNKALRTTDSFLESYASHQRAVEARALRGDIFMGQGKLEEAINAFKKVMPDDGPLFSYATFQIGKIYKALESHEALRDHFNHYLIREDTPKKTRITEALYWIGWAHTQEGHPEKAVSVFLSAIDTYGNDPKAEEVVKILGELQKIVTKVSSDQQKQSSKNTPLNYDSFENWLEAQKQDALIQQKHTWFARIQLYLAKIYEKRRKYDLRDATLLSIAEHTPQEDLGAQGLAEVGHSLRELELPNAATYYETLIENYPDSFNIGDAYFGLAELEYESGTYTQAQHWLSRFTEETPYHPFRTKAHLLKGSLLVENQSPKQAIETFESLLKQKQARGRPHAEALIGIAEAQVALKNLKAAIAYYQRVYTLYRAYGDLVAKAYLESGKLFEAINDPQAAMNSYQTLIRNTGDQETLESIKAKEAIERLKATRNEPNVPS